MESQPTQNLVPSPVVRRAGTLATLALIGGSLVVMAGWQFRIPLLRGQIFGSFVAPNSALCFLVCGISILLLASGGRLRPGIGTVLAVLVATFGLLSVVEHVFGVDLNIDRRFFAHRMSDWWLPIPGRIAFTSSIAFLVSGVGLIFLRRRTRIYFSDLAGSICLGVAYIGIIGYLFSFRPFYGRVMAVPTALFFVMLGVAILCHSSSGWVVNSLSNPRLGGFLVRRLTAAILLVVPGLGLLETLMERDGWISPEGGMAILVLLVVAVFTTLVLRTASVMNAVDEAREFSQHRATALSEELGALIEASPVGIVRFRRDRTVSSWSRAAESMLGWRAEEIMGKPLPVQAHSGHDWSELIARLATGASLANIETKQIRKDGSVMDALVSGAPIRNEEGEVQEFIGVIVDSTELKLAREAIIRTEKLSAAGRLAASIAHEINNPLEAVTNLLYLARSDQEHAQDYLAMADEELVRVAHLAKQTLGFYRDSGIPDLVDISQLVQGVLNIYHSRLKSKRIQVVKDFHANDLVRTIAGEVRQVISNLVANAIDACPDNGVITIRTRNSHEQNGAAPGIQITVADNGSGIDPVVRNKIWEPFFTTKKDVGTGLGLWVSKQIIEKRAGFIRIRSNKRGTVFMFAFPSMAAQSNGAGAGQSG